MSKPVFAMLLGGILGVFDGLTRARFRRSGDPVDDWHNRGGLHVQRRRCGT